MNMESQLEDTKVPFSSWWMIAVLFVFYVLSIVDRAILSMLVDPIQKDLGLSDFQMSLLLGPAFVVFYSIAGFPLGWLADRYSRRNLIGLGVIAWSLSTIASGLSRAFMPLVISRIAVGVGEASLTPAAYSLIADKFPRKRLTTAMSIYGTAPKVGTAVAFSVGALLLSTYETKGVQDVPVIGIVQPWQLVLLTLGLVGILLSLLSWTFSEPPRGGRTKKGDVPSEKLLAFVKKQRAIIIPVVTGFGLISLASAALTSWVPTYLTRSFGWGPATYAPIISVISLMMASTVIFKGLIVDWLFGRGMKDAHIRFFTWLLGGSIPILLVAFFMDDAMHFLVLYGIASIASMTFLVYLSSILQLVTPPELRGQITAIGLLGLAIIGSGLGPILVALLTDFVFQDQAAIGKSICIVAIASMVAGWLLLRMSLKPIRDVITQSEGALVSATE